MNTLDSLLLLDFDSDGYEYGRNDAFDQNLHEKPTLSRM